MIEPTAFQPTLTEQTGPSLQIGDRDPLKVAAEAFEAVFLAEMLSHSGMGKASSSFGGGVGEDAFASFLTRAWAEKLAAEGGLGLADKIQKSLAAKAYNDV